MQEYASALTATEKQRPMRVQYDTPTPARPLDAIETARAAAPSSSSSDTETVTAEASSSSAADSTPSAPRTYQVTRGDTLVEIAHRFDVTVQELQAWNDLNGTRLYPGQRLQIRD